ncbi:hypothetical protein Sango_3076200 [Sesamum angolense]|uniref:Reverse transcriptase domain-containing protein n=1 Tax=Sesamum angolense TaxID=2727404 RepID=A0AAE1T945_9LAMI|nr:hypothetical protein Sango_3076200 [Sesamum angolense]
MIHAGSKRWNTTAVGYFLGKKPYFHHLNEFVHSLAGSGNRAWFKKTETHRSSGVDKTSTLASRTLDDRRFEHGGEWNWTTALSSAITRACTRLDFARVCIMLNVNSKLPKHVVIMMPNELGGESACKVDVEYEWLPPKCTGCSSLGHSAPELKISEQGQADLVQEEVHPETETDRVGEESSEYGKDKSNDIVLFNAFDVLEKTMMTQTARQGVLTNATPQMFPMLNTAIWNVRGLNRRDHQVAVRDLVSEFRLHFIALLETRVMQSNVTRIQLGVLSRWRWFVHYAGPGNRIWIAWNDELIDVEFLNVGSQFVHCRVLIHELHETILITVVYGANEVSARRELWQGLIELAVTVGNVPWLVGGDFNAVLVMSEVSGASGDIRVAMNEFNDCILQTGLLSMPMQGERFTWHNCSLDGRSLWKRLHRLLVNDVNLFRFDNYLALSPGFLASVQSIWRHPVNGTLMYSVTRKLKALKSVFRQQRRSKGDLAKNVKLAAGFLEVAQNILQFDRHNSLLLLLQHYCRLVYLKASKLEQVMLRQRAKLQRLKGGDQCSKVFFRRVATKRANKRIFQISDDDGNEQTEPTIISSIFVDFFQAFFDIEEDKAPGPDGFSSGFFKAAWPVAGEEVSKAIIDFFKTSRLLKQLNATLLTLIPKVQTPHSVAEFRPISCCNVVYKVISKIIVSRIREILDLLISPSQHAFVPGRLISDNILLAQELFSGYNQCRLPPRCALKVDLRKAYDTVEWDFLIATLRMFGFPTVFIRWIEECVTSAHYSVVVNGGVHGFIAGALGLRQGDPMSPYLFVLVMEVLHMILQQLIEQDGEFQYHWRCKDLNLFQLSFADDLLLFCKADVRSEGHLPVRYLGLPLISARLSVADCQPLLQKIDSRIKGIINEMIKRLRTFLWKGTSSSGYPKVAWEAVCRPIEEGGLGIKDILALNRALMSKQNQTYIWVDWIIQIRLRDCSIWTVKDNKGAWGWRKMLSLRHSLVSQIHFCVGNGDSISLWHDPWHPLGPLISRFPRDPS